MTCTHFVETTVFVDGKKPERFREPIPGCPYCTIDRLTRQLEAQAKEIARSKKFIEQAFIAHPNLDLDIQAAIGQSVERK